MSDVYVTCLSLEVEIFVTKSSSLVHKCEAREEDWTNNSFLKCWLITTRLERCKGFLQDTCLIGDGLYSLSCSVKICLCRIVNMKSILKNTILIIIFSLVTFLNYSPWRRILNGYHNSCIPFRSWNDSITMTKSNDFGVDQILVMIEEKREILLGRQYLCN